MSQDISYDEWIGASASIQRPDSYWQEALNESQWQAVQHCDGPLLVIAGAGSGKTRVLTYKIAYMLDRGLHPWQILALTFTNKAAREMNDRISAIVGTQSASGLWSGTFHSIFARILRIECDSIGYHQNFTIYDTADQRSLLKSIIKEMQLDDKVYKPNIVGNRISDAKNRLILPDAYAADESIIAQDQMNNLGEIHRIYRIYWQRCRTAEAMDFDDLLLYTYLLFDRNESIRQKYATRFRYILVDEYQDTNYAQHKIISQLTRDNQHICVVGDDAQSIYSFRGANIDNILHFTRQYPNARMVKLERNYRSTQRIVEAANSIIAHNRGQIQKRVYSENSEGAPLTVMPASSDKEEAGKVVGTIKRLVHDEGLSLNDIAVLYRTNAQSRPFEEAFGKANVKYRVYGSLSFYQRKEIKDLIAYFRLTVNLDDEEAFKRIVNYPARGIGNTTLQKIITASREHNASLWAVVERPTEFGLSLNRGTLAKLESFCALILQYRQAAQQTNAYELAVEILSTSGIQHDLATSDEPEAVSKRENIQELIDSIADYQNNMLVEQRRPHAPLADYLSQVALLTDADQKDDGSPKVTLMTIHAAKGLEFGAVFVTGLEQELFPASSALLFPKEMEEERRLFYVAVTRAKDFCYLTYAKSRFRYGNMDFPEPSQFIREIDRRFVQEGADSYDFLAQGIQPSRHAALFSQQPARPAPVATSPTPRSATVGSQPSRPVVRNLRRVASVTHSNPSGTAGTSPATTHGLSVGTVIDHSRFGRGRVIGLEGTGDSAKALVEFDTSGPKNLLLKFAKFTIVS